MQPSAPFTAPATVNEQSLAQSALERVRAIMKGNGVKLDTITVASQKITYHTLHAGTYLELKPQNAEKISPGKSVVGQLVASREEAMRQVDQAMVQAANNATAKAQIANVLLSRPDQGFGLARQTVPLDFLKKEFTWHEGCTTCNGTSNAPCQRCQGRKIEPCTKCSGRGLMICPLCRATGLLQGQKCTKCHGQRYVPCDLCRRSGMMNCRMCNALGTMKCPTCAGQGWKTHVLTLSAQALTYFEYDGKAVPKGAADMIETQAGALASQQRIKVTGRIADDKENVLGANYEVEFPYGDIVFTLGKNEVKANLFGYKGELINFPYVLDKVVLRTVEDLEDAARGAGDVAGTIKKATRYRVIAQGFIMASKTSAKKTVNHLLKLYDIGLSQGMAEKIALLADQTTARITSKPRTYGLIGGLLLTAALCAGYYMTPARSSIASYLPNAKLDFILDLLPLALGGMITTMCIQMAGAGAIRKALGHLMPQGQKKALVSKAGSSGWWGWAGTVIIMLGTMEYVSSGGAGPYWYEFARNFVSHLF